MTKSSRSSRREAARRAESASPASRWLLPAAGLAIAAVAVVAILLSQGSIASPGASATSSAPAAASPIAAKPPIVTGTPLPTYANVAPDPAVGLSAPRVDGHDYAGQPVSIAPSGRTTMVVFAAHWCAHCQREIPLLQAWVDDGGLPAGVDIVTVSTGVDPARPNYPPEDWFSREGWTAPIIVDPTNSVAAAYGLASYPYFVILDGSGKVVSRLIGEIPTADLERLLQAVPAG